MSDQTLHLVVNHPFGKYQRGDKIRDAQEIKDILHGKPVEGEQYDTSKRGENSSHVGWTIDPESN